MKKAAIRKRTAALALGGAMSLSCLAGAVAAAFTDGRKVALAAGNVVNVDASMQYQTFDGWGTSLAWWANECGDWTREHSSGITQREYIMQLLFGEEGLNWNIARYNVGGGENPDPDHPTHLAYDTKMPGFQDEKDGVYDWDNGDGTVKHWSETADARQLWVLDAFQNIREGIAAKNGTESDAITEFFSNSPPYWMTTNNCVGGAGKTPNLKSEYISDYVDYFVAVYKYLIDQGFAVDLLQPFNESSTNGVGWGSAEGGKGNQEGCAFSPQQKVQVLQGIMQKINALAAQDIKYAAGYNFGDEVDTGRAIKELDEVSKISGGKDVIAGADKLTYHIYGYEVKQAQEIYRRAKANGQKAEMSEITFGKDSAVYDPNLMTTALNDYSNSIIKIVKYGAAESYVFWQGMENLTGLINTGWSYGLLHGVYDNPAMPDTVSGYDLASLGLAYQDVRTCKSYYVAGQYSKYIQPGYQIVEADEGKSIAAVSPDGDKLVIVKENNGSSAASLKFNLDYFNGNKITKIYTDPDHNWSKEVIGESSSGLNSFDDTVTPYSVTTYVIEGALKAGRSHIVDESQSVSKASLAAVPADEKEGVYTIGTWNNGGQNNDSFAGESLYNNGNGNAGNYYVAVRFYGTGVGILAERKSDSAVLQYWSDPALEGGALPATADGEVDTTLATGHTYRQQVLRVNNLKKGWHTVYLKVKSGWLNLDGVFVIDGADDTAAVTKPVVTNLFGNNKTLYVNFNGVEGASGYTVEYRKAGNSSWTSYDAATVTSVKIADNGLSAGDYEVRVKATVNSADKYSDICIVKMNATPDGLLYYVDCGTSNFSDGGWGRAYGACQSTFDKSYGADGLTGISWGMTSDSGYEAAGWTAEDPFSSIYYGGGSNKIIYKFTIPAAGDYVLTVGGFRPQGWGDRSYTATITGTGAAADPKGQLSAKAMVASTVAIPFSTNEDNKEITVTIPSPDGLSLLVITAKDKPVPIMAEAKSNYTMNGDYDHSGVTKNGDKYLGEELGGATALNLVMSDGTKKEFSTANGGLTLISQELSELAEDEYYTAGYTVGGSDWDNNWPAMTVYATYQLKVQKDVTQEYKVLEPEVLYYFIDSGSFGSSSAFTAGSLQTGGARDQKYNGSNVWGYVDSRSGESGCNWKDDVPESSIREMNSGSGYVMTGFTANQAFTLEVGMNCQSWGGRKADVYVGGSYADDAITGGTKVGTIEMVQNGGVKVGKYEVTADANGTLVVSFIKVSGDNPQIAYIKAFIPAVIQEEISSGSPVLPAIKVGQSAYFRQGFTKGNEPDIVLSGLVEGARVYVIGSNDTFVDSFVATGASYAWNAWDKVPADAYGLRFTQAKKEATISSMMGSTETVVALPWIDVAVDSKPAKMGGISIVVTPTLGNVPKEIFGAIDSVRVVGPEGGAGTDIIGSFFYRTDVLGEHTVIIVCNDVTYTTKIIVEGTIESPEVYAVYTPDNKTHDEMTIKLTAGVGGVGEDAEFYGIKAGVSELYVKKFTGTAPDQYTFTEDDLVMPVNGVYEYTDTVIEDGYIYLAKVVTAWGSERVFTYKIFDRFDTTELNRDSVEINPNYGSAGGVVFDFGAEQDGKLGYKLNDGEEVQVDNFGSFTATKPGKYEVYFVSYNNYRSDPVIYYLTEGAENAELATVSVGEDGTVSVSDPTVTAKLYFAGKNTPLGDLKVGGLGKYYLELTKGDETEIIVIDTAKSSTADNVTVIQPNPVTPGNNTNNKGGSNTTDIALTVVFAALAVAVAAGAVVIVIKRRKA